MNILLTSAGRRAYIVDYFKAAVQPYNGHVFCSNSEYSIALERADDYCITPIIYSDEYIPTLLKFCQEHQVQLLLSLFDIDLLVLARNRERFADIGVTVVIGNPDFIEICNDKWLTYQFALQYDIRAPQSFLSVDDVLQAIARHEVQFPIIIKPRWGMASLFIYRVDNEEELRVLAEKSTKEIFNSYLKYESSLTHDHPLIFQEIIRHQEYGIDVVNDLQRNYIGVCPKSKLRMRSGETDLGQTAPPDQFEAFARKLSTLANHQGILSVDCFTDGTDFWLLEMNCRISGHYPLSHLAGFHYPEILLEDYATGHIDPKRLQFNAGLYITKDLIPTVLKQGY